MIETEKRYLLKYIPEKVKNAESQEIEDYMILTNEPHPHLRLRRINDKYQLTKKYPISTENNLQMVEETIILNDIEFNVLKKLKTTGQIKKRYKFKTDKYLEELDIWRGDLNGLAIVEFEFNSIEIAGKFTPPDYCLAEITEIESLAGGKLSGKKYLEIQNILKEYNYQPFV